MKRTLEVTTTKTIEIEFTDALFEVSGSQAQYLRDFNEGMWRIKGIDDVFVYAAGAIAEYGHGVSHDFLGTIGVDSKVKYTVIDDCCNINIIED